MTVTSMIRKLYSMKGSSSDTFGQGEPWKAHDVSALLSFHSFSPALIETSVSTVQYITLKYETDITEGNGREEERPGTCDINHDELTCFQMFKCV